MRCPECEKEGQESTVREEGYGFTTTAAGGGRWWDAQGVEHVHYANTSTTAYRCSRGHSWVEKRPAI